MKVDELLGEIDETAVPAQPARPPRLRPSPHPLPQLPAAAASAPAAARAPAPACVALRSLAAGAEPVRRAEIVPRRANGRRRARDRCRRSEGHGTRRRREEARRAGSRAAHQRPTPAAQRAQRRNTRAPRPGERETREKMTTRRKRIAENLLQSQHATAHLTTFNEIDMSAVNALRERMKEKVEKEHGVKLTFMPFFVKAACMALKTYPVVNAQIDGDSIIYKHYVNMGIAVASDAGLVVPNIKDADRRGCIDVGRDIGAVAKRARDGKLTMDDLTGGTFTITNGGVFGSLVSTPIINFPQVGILGLHKTQDRPVGDEREGRDPPDDVRRALVRSPGHRRPAGGAVPRAREGADGGSRRDADLLKLTER